MLGQKFIMRWIRKKWALFAACIAAYFFAYHTGPNRFDFALVVLLGFILVFGSAILDRIFFDPSAIHMLKPWRVLQPSAGDTFRLVFLAMILVSLVAFCGIEGLLKRNSSAIDGLLIVLFLFVWDGSRYSKARVRWHGTMVDIDSRITGHHVARWNEISSVKRDFFGDYLVFRTHKGQKLKVSRHLRGYSEFIRDAERYCHLDVQQALKVVK